MRYFGFLVAFEKTHPRARAYSMAYLSRFFPLDSLILLESWGGYTCIAEKNAETVAAYKQMEDCFFNTMEGYTRGNIIGYRETQFELEADELFGIVQQMYKEDIPEILTHLKRSPIPAEMLCKIENMDSVGMDLDDWL
jgi:hypothetical protein